MEKKQASIELRKIYKSISDDNVNFKVDRNQRYDSIGNVNVDRYCRVVVSICPYQKNHVKNYNFIETIIHEMLHIVYPNKQENEIEQLGIDVFSNLGDKQIQNLLIKVSDRFI